MTTKSLIEDGSNLDQNMRDDSLSTLSSQPASKKLKRVAEDENEPSDIQPTTNTRSFFPTARAFVRKVTSDALEDEEQQQQPQLQKKKNAELYLRQYARDLQQRANQGIIFGCDEKESNNDLTTIEHSLLNLLPQQHSMDLESMRELLQSVAHLSHKDWNVTERNAHQLHKILFYDANEKESTHVGALNRDVRQVLHRVLRDGNFDKAVAAASQSERHVPWAVLVTVCIVQQQRLFFFFDGISNETILLRVSCIRHRIYIRTCCLIQC
jgi:hypothetical protein